jgi:hypothetical protein
MAHTDNVRRVLYSEEKGKVRTMMDTHTPTLVNGCEVVASIRLWHVSSGSLPDGHMVVVRERAQHVLDTARYTVWLVARESDPDKWVANNGHYGLDYVKACHVMFNRAMDLVELR